jgi:hypothetical protein
MENKHTELDASSSEKDFLALQYTALREEILKHQDTQFQVLGLTLFIAGTLLSIGVQQNVSVRVLLIYPLLTPFLASVWASGHTATLRIGTYISEVYEKNLSIVGWETLTRKTNKQSKRISFHRTSTRGLFLVTQIVAIALAFSRFPLDYFDYSLIGIDLIAMIFTFYILRGRRESTSQQFATLLTTVQQDKKD